MAKDQSEGAARRSMAEQGLATMLMKSLHPSLTNPRKRFDEKALQDLAESIKSHGVIEPLILRERAEGGYEIIAGERRFRAARMAGLMAVPAILRNLNDRQVAELQLIENDQRQDLDDVERSEAYWELHSKHGVKVEDLARTLGRSESGVRSIMRLRDLPAIATKALRDGTISPSVANLIAARPSLAMREKVAEFATKKQDWELDLPTVAEVKRWIGHKCMREIKGAPFDPKEKGLANAPSCKDCPLRTGNDREQYPDGRADVCTAPDCYAAKVAAWRQRATDAAKKEGKEVLNGTSTRDLFQGRYLRMNAGYVDVNDPAAHHKAAGKTYEKWLGKELAGKTVIAFDEEGYQHELAKRVDIDLLLKSRGIEADTGARHMTSEDKAERANRVLEGKIESTANQALVIQGGAVFSEYLFLPSNVNGKPHKLLCEVVKLILTHTPSPSRELVARTLDLKLGSANEVLMTLQHYAECQIREGLTQLLGRLLAAHQLCPWSSGEKDRVFELLGLDQKAAMREATAALKPAKQPKPTKTPTAT